MGMRIWLDDQYWLPKTSKSTPQGWIGVGSVEELQKIIDHPDFNGIDEMSFDWDLGDQQPNGMMAMELLARMAEERRDPKYWPKNVRVHTTHEDWRVPMIKFAQETRAKLRTMFPATTPAPA